MLCHVFEVGNSYGNVNLDQVWGLVILGGNTR